MASKSLTDVRIDQRRRHTQGPSELVAAHRAKISTNSSPNLYQPTPKISRAGFGDKLDYGPQVPSDFVYVNGAYVGSSNSVNENALEPPSSVTREQYWACSRWPYTQRVLAIAVGVLLGAVIGLIVTVILRQTDQDFFPDFFTRKSSPE